MKSLTTRLSRVTMYPDLRMHTARVPNPIFDDLSTLADVTRSRMLLLLDRHELTVSELCDILQLPQSTVSRHLKTLADGNWISSRRDGTRRMYTLLLDEVDESAKRLWEVVREQVEASSAGIDDDRRLRQILSNRRMQSE